MTESPNQIIIMMIIIFIIFSPLLLLLFSLVLLFSLLSFTVYRLLFAIQSGQTKDGNKGEKA